MPGNKLGKKRSVQVPLGFHSNEIDGLDGMYDLTGTQLQTCGTQQARE